MGEETVTAGALAVSVLLLVGLFRRGGVRNGLFIVAAFFMLFSFGQVVNHLLGRTIYFGVVVENIPQASVGFSLALAAIWLADRLAPQRADYLPEQIGQPVRLRFEALPLAYVATIFYSLFFTVPRLPTLLGASKSEALELAGPGHFAYMTVATCLVAFYFVTRRTKLMQQLYTIHCFAFILYSLSYRERDFLLVIIAVLVHREIVSRKKRSPKIVLAGVGSVLGATWLFSARTGGDGFSIEGILNQGLILFIDTFVMRFVPEDVGYQWGGTYIDAVLRLPPQFLIEDSDPTLSESLVEVYNPSGSVGYGFSLTAEAYLNFGMLGIPAVFLVIGLVHRHLINRLDRGDFYPYASIFFMQAWMYALRGDSLQLIKTMTFAAIIFIVFQALSSKSREALVPARVRAKRDRASSGS